MSDELNNNPAPIITKVCSKCNTEYPLDNYRKNPSNKKDGLQLECKKCNNERASNYYQKNKKKIIKGILSSRKKKSKLQKEIEKLELQIVQNVDTNILPNS
jgi:hypothetical protein